MHTRFLWSSLLALLLAVPAFGQAADPLDVQAGPLDNGRMWTFENPPTEYLQATYGFEADAAWFENARLSALRIPGCSASFVSPNGLVVTNHHCTRGRIAQVSREGENLLDNGFYAASMDEERPIENYYVEQLIAIEDVTEAVYAQLTDGGSAEERAQARESAAEALEAEIAGRFGGEEAGIQVQVVSLYNGGRYSAYVFRRYTDVRLVAAPELQLGYFGGDADNFTYPRFALDFSFLRVYDTDGQPMETPNYFTWTDEGVQEDDLIFVIGNPGSTTRLATVAQLEYLRDIQVPYVKRAIDARIEAMQSFAAEDPEAAGDVRNQLFGLLNSQKAYGGRLAALQDPYIIARRADAQQDFRTALEADPELAQYAALFDEMADLQAQRRALGPAYGSFLFTGNPNFSSAVLRRAVVAQRYLRATGDEKEELKAQLLAIPSHPAALERRLLTLRLREIERYFGADSEVGQAVLQGYAPDVVAETVLTTSSLASAASTDLAVSQNTLRADDPAVQIWEALQPAFFAFQQQNAMLNAQEQEIASQLGRARFDVYGTTVPPDATFSLRITDGVVKGYAYNGTIAPPYTNFYGLYDHYYSYGTGTEWDLPERWLNPPPTFDLSTPLNFASTADTIGGNSGSPAINREQELVGLNFDRNIEGLVRDYIFLPERGRNVMVDARAIREALDDIYDADRIVQELLTGQLFPTEAEADAAASGSN